MIWIRVYESNTGMRHKVCTGYIVGLGTACCQCPKMISAFTVE